MALPDGDHVVCAQIPEHRVVNCPFYFKRESHKTFFNRRRAKFCPPSPGGQGCLTRAPQNVFVPSAILAAMPQGKK